MMGTFFVLRAAVAIIFFAHAIPKLRDPRKWGSGLGWSYGQALALGVVEFFGALGLLSRVNPQFSALLLMAVMFGALYHKIFKWKTPFKAHDKTGWEFDFLIMCALLTIYFGR